MLRLSQLAFRGQSARRRKTFAKGLAMYKLLLCVRYLRTRYIALASIVSVMLGVATMIVVNSVMSGFANEMRERINGILADVIIETNSLNGETDAEFHRQLAMQAAGDQIESISMTVEVFGLMHFRRGGQWIPRPVTLVGIEPENEAKVGPLVANLDSFQTIREDGIVTREPLRKEGEAPGWKLTEEALAWRSEWKEYQRRHFANWPAREAAEPLMPEPPAFEPEPGHAEPQFDSPATASPEPGIAAEGPVQLEVPLPLPGIGPAQPSQVIPAAAIDDGENVRQASNPFATDEAPDLKGMVVEKGRSDIDAPLPGRLYIGAQLVEIPRVDRKTDKVFIERLVKPGDDVKISTVSAGSPPEPRHFFATVVDVYKSGMSEYDANLVFCNLEYLQEMRGMIDPQTGKGAITTMKIKLKDYNNSDQVVKQLENVFPPHLYTVRTWEQKQGPLLAAVDIESAILNVLLFLIIAVAGFGILAIFFMIVVEKTRDIGILKALGASSRGVMSIFLAYGLALGVVGSGVGVVCGLLFVRYINVIEGGISWLTGRKVFDERIYYFPTIPTEVSFWTVTWVALGSILIAVLASVLPARRAARLHPVEALRYE
ncbi:MAG: FtsX-like permease family protein [Planctomycetota bacterium]|nr:FtsX-like permease family protein [Planctomycetota bacterium]